MCHFHDRRQFAWEDRLRAAARVDGPRNETDGSGDETGSPGDEETTEADRSDDAEERDDAVPALGPPPIDVPELTSVDRLSVDSLEE